jgi:hypothetical protein
MNRFLILLQFLFLTFSSLPVMAQFSLVGEVRPRSEFRNGFKTTRDPDTDPAFFIEQRSRIYLDYQRKNLRFHIAIQDIRIWGNAAQIYKTDPALTNLFEGWGSLNMAGNWWLKVGRQVISYDNQRFLGGLDWAQQGRSHDAVMVSYVSAEKGLTLDIAFAYNQNVPYEPANLTGTAYIGIANYKTMQYARLNKKFDKGNLSALVHNDGQQTVDTAMAYRQTLAVYTAWDLGDVSLGGDMYYQTGKNASKMSVSGLMVAAYVTIKTRVSPITFGFDYLSGTPYDEQEKDLSFNPLYGTNHKFYGHMDYFYVGNPHGQGGNLGGLIDLYLTTDFKLSEKSALAGNVHYFASPVSVYDPEHFTSTLSASLGPEIDLAYSLKISGDASLWLGYSHIFPTESMVAIKRGGGDTSAMHNWAWVMIQFKPTLFVSDKPSDK